jgi:hypothetical protein
VGTPLLPIVQHRTEAKVQLPVVIRDSLVEDLDDMLEAYASGPDTEAVVRYLLEQLEILADEEGIDEVLSELEDDASLEAPLADLLELEMASNDEFEFTGEEVVSLLERICEIEWENDEDDWDDEDDEDLTEDLTEYLTEYDE